MQANQHFSAFPTANTSTNKTKGPSNHRDSIKASNRMFRFRVILYP